MREDPSVKHGEGDPDLGTFWKGQINMAPVRFPTITLLDILRRTVLRSETWGVSKTTSVSVALWLLEGCPRTRALWQWASSVASVTELWSVMYVRCGHEGLGVRLDLVGAAKTKMSGDAASGGGQAPGRFPCRLPLSSCCQPTPTWGLQSTSRICDCFERLVLRGFSPLSYAF